MDDESWNDTSFWVKELKYYLPQQLEDGMPVIMLGNKKDLVDKNDEQKAVTFRQVILSYIRLFSMGVVYFVNFEIAAICGIINFLQK